MTKLILLRIKIIGNGLKVLLLESAVAIGQQAVDQLLSDRLSPGLGDKLKDLRVKMMKFEMDRSCEFQNEVPIDLVRTNNF